MFSKINFSVVRASVISIWVAFVIIACSGDSEPLTKNIEKVLDDQPVFNKVSDQAVLLRYKFKKGDEHITRIEFDLNAEVQRDKRIVTSKQHLNMQIRYQVESLDDNEIANIKLLISRIQMRMSGIKNLSYDSDVDLKSSRPEFDMYNMMVNVPINLKVNSRGKIFTLDIAKVMEKIKQSGNKVLATNMNRMMSEIKNKSFLELPDNSVKMGDIFTAGSISSSIPNVGVMNIETKYKVAAVSADRKKVLFQPLTDYEIKPQNQRLFNMEIQRVQVKAWVLFDLAKGNVVKSSSRFRMNALSTLQGISSTTRIDSTIKSLHN